MTVHFSVKAERLKEFLQTMAALLAEVRGTPGNQEALLAQSVEEDGTYLVHMLWTDTEALDHYLASDGFKVLLGAVGTLGERSRFRFIADSSERSAEYTAKVRGIAAQQYGRPA